MVQTAFSKTPATYTSFTGGDQFTKGKLTYSKPFEVHFCQSVWRQGHLRVTECIWRIRGYPDTLLHLKESSGGLWNFA